MFRSDRSVTTARVSTALPQQSVTESGCVVMAAFRNALRHEHTRTCRSVSCFLLLFSLSIFFFVDSLLLSCVCIPYNVLSLSRLQIIYSLVGDAILYVYFCCTPRFYPHLRTRENSSLFLSLSVLGSLSHSCPFTIT